MDAFFAAIEQRDHPELKGKPIAVGYDGPRGVVSTASYEARPFGVHSAQSIVIAKHRCPQLIVVPPHFEVYKNVSRQIHGIFREYTDIVEPISIDEAFLDVTKNKFDIEMAVDIAREIKQKIHERTGLTASAGISYNKFLAKIASDWKKPDGLYVVHPDHALDFIGNLPVEKFWGVGKKTAERLFKMGIFNGYQLRHSSRSHLISVFGKIGAFYHDVANGIDDRPVIVERERKSVGCEQTYLQDLTNDAQVTIELYHLVLELQRRITKTDFHGHTLTLKVKYSDFTQITRSLTHSDVLTTKEQILPLAKHLFRISQEMPLNEKDKHPEYAIRLLGLSLSHANIGADENSPEWIEGELEFDD